MHASFARVLLVAALLGVAGCGAQQRMRDGDALLARGQYAEAIAAYEEALRDAPDNGEARERIREARRGATRAVLRRAEDALAEGALAKALAQAMRARRMPFDLEDVDLVRRIDDLVARAAAEAEARVRELTGQGQFLSAIELSQEVAAASAGSRDAWAAQVRERGLTQYTRVADELAPKLPGSAALQLAMALRAGAKVPTARVQELWGRFAEPTCFGVPAVSVVDPSDHAEAFVPTLTTSARLELDALRARCGEGTRPLGVKIVLQSVDIVDKSEKHRVAKPLPGVVVQTEETYYVDEPYTDVEEVTELEVKREMRERRDCAPRPGKPRGCTTWNEEVEVKVPVTRKVEVQKVRRIAKTRPLQQELPPDKAVMVDVVTVTRRVACKGTVQVEGASGGPVPFAVAVDSSDSTNDEVRTPALTVPADPLVVEPIAKLMADATVEVSRATAEAVVRAVAEWARADEEKAKADEVAGRMPEAEEAYLRLLALGAPPSPEMQSFFERRYGRPVGEVLDLLLVALGRARPGAGDEATATAAATARFPTREPRESSGATPTPTPTQTAAGAEGGAAAATHAPAVSGTTTGGVTPVSPATATPAPATTSDGARSDKGIASSALSDEELRALEADSLEAAGGGGAKGAPQGGGQASGQGGGGGASGAGSEKTPTNDAGSSGGPASDDTPKRGPVTPSAGR